MEKIEKRLFLDELDTLCNFVIYAVTSANSSFYSGSDYLWYSLQNIVTYTADISKILWGSNQSESDRRKEFRKELHIADNSAIRNKHFRNHFEHIDERLKKFSKVKPNLIVNKNISDSDNAIVVNGKPFIFKDQYTLRSLDLKRMQFVIFGDSYDLQRIVPEVNNLSKRIKELKLQCQFG
ncbi:hypothetical protein [Limosilactobacillus urinaemulieris]|uniref:hypothetical protein n=1 Tax=Limosilactobacillus urinaemulieris TaxID=2742600 RepID=UPI0028F1020A|nr:hypothetical protein [Limosilactobacillus urinaemulieris]